MRVLITGVGDAFTSRHFGSSALIDAPQGYVLIDCPDLVHRAVREAGDAAGWNVDASRIHDIILTHIHGDHCNGLESFGFLRRVMRIKNPRANLPIPRLHTTKPVADRLWDRLAPAMDGPFDGRPASSLDDYYDLRLVTPGRHATVAGLTIDCRFTHHPVPTIGLMISNGAATLGWSGDTPYEPEHIDWLSPADVIVHECNVGPTHTPIDRLNALPDDLRTKMRLIHLTDDFDPSTTDIPPLHERQVIKLT